MTKPVTFGHAKAPAPPAPGGQRLLTWADLVEKGIHYHSNLLRRLVEKKKFPAPIHLSKRRIAWSEKEIDDWIEAKLKAREAS